MGSEMCIRDRKNCWFVPDWWETEKELEDEFSGGNIGDLEDAMG